MNSSLLRHPAVVAGVVVGLLAVIALNLRTFGPARRLAGHGIDRAVGHLVPPADLSQVVHDAVYGDDTGRGVALAGGGQGMGLARDPFSGASLAPRTVVTAPVKSHTPSKQRQEPLSCTAVMLGGARPLALVGGKAYGPGDRVRDQEVVAITTEGVRLRDRKGRETLLAVGPAPADSTSFHVVTRPVDRSDAGVTRLATDRPERTDR